MGVSPSNSPQIAADSVGGVHLLWLHESPNDLKYRRWTGSWDFSASDSIVTIQPVYVYRPQTQTCRQQNDQHQQPACPVIFEHKHLIQSFIAIDALSINKTAQIVYPIGPICASFTSLNRPNLI